MNKKVLIIIIISILSCILIAMVIGLFLIPVTTCEGYLPGASDAGGQKTAENDGSSDEKSGEEDESGTAERNISAEEFDALLKEVKGLQDDEKYYECWKKVETSVEELPLSEEQNEKLKSVEATCLEVAMEFYLRKAKEVLYTDEADTYDQCVSYVEEMYAGDASAQERVQRCRVIREDSKCFQSEYRRTIDEFKTQNEYCFHGTLQDINEDGIPELFLWDGTDYASDGRKEAYTFYDKKPVKLTDAISIGRDYFVYYVSGRCILEMNSDFQDGMKQITIYEMTEGDLVKRKEYEVVGLDGIATDPVPEYTESGNAISEETFIAGLKEYGFDGTGEIQSERYDDVRMWEHIQFGFERSGLVILHDESNRNLLKKMVENYGTDEFDREMERELCDGGYGGFEFRYSEEYASDWKKEYHSILENERTILNLSASGSEEPDRYFVYDIDKDGMPELFIRYGKCEADYTFSVFTYEDGKVRTLCDKEECGHSTFISLPGNGFCRYFAHMGGYFIDKYEKVDGELKGSSIDSGGEDYPYVTDIDPGASEITEYGFKFDLPLLAYDVDIHTNSSLPPEKAKAEIETVLAEDGYVYSVVEDDFRPEIGWGYVRLSSLREKGMMNDYHNMKLNTTSWGDLNGDGQEECLLLYKATDSDSNYSAVVLSYQCGIVYAYCLGFYGKEANIEDGKIVTDSWKSPIRFFKTEVCMP